MTDKQFNKIVDQIVKTAITAELQGITKDEVISRYNEVLESYGAASIGEVGTMDVPKREGYGIYKDPITDDGTKKSLRGLLQVYVAGQDENGVITFGVKEDCTPEEESQGLLQTIYEDGKFYNQVTLDQVRDKLLNSK